MRCVAMPRDTERNMPQYTAVHRNATYSNAYGVHELCTGEIARTGKSAKRIDSSYAVISSCKRTQ